MSRHEYECAVCHKRFMYEDPKVSCTVQHASGGCCHYGEHELPTGPRD